MFPAEESGEEPQKMPYPRLGPDDMLRYVAVKLCSDLGLASLGQTVKVVWNARMRTAAGRANYRLDLIELNPRLQDLPDDIRESSIRETFLHELAHLVAKTRAGKQRIAPHGVEWQQACRELGISGESVYHNLPLAPVRRVPRRYAYACTHCGKLIRRARPLARASACYYCCQAYSGGKFDRRFMLQKVLIDPPSP